MTIVIETREATAHEVAIDKLANELVEKMSSLPAANIIYYFDNFEQAQGMLVNVEPYEDLSEAIWVMLHSLAELNGEAFAVELSKYFKEGRFVEQSDVLALSLLGLYADKGGAASTLFFNRYLRNIKTFDASDTRFIQKLLQTWTEVEVFDPDKLGPKHRPAYDRVMAIDVEALFAAEAAAHSARMATRADASN